MFWEIEFSGEILPVWLSFETILKQTVGSILGLLADCAELRRSLYFYGEFTDVQNCSITHNFFFWA